MPTVSVIIPTYNRPVMIGKAIQSVLNQTYQDFELIVVDDGTQERAEAEVKKIGDSHIKYIAHETNKGGAAARNTGIKAAQGDFIAFLDDDDEWLPEKLEIQMKEFEGTPKDVGFCFTSMNQIRDHGEYKTEVDEGIKDYFEATLFQFNRFITSTLIIKKDVFSDIGFFDENLPSHQETDLIIRIAKKFKGLGINKQLVNMTFKKSGYEHVGGNITKRIEGREIVLKKNLSEYEKRPVIFAKHYFWLGLLYRDSGRLVDAIESFKKAWRHDFKMRYFAHYIYLLNKKVRSAGLKVFLEKNLPHSAYERILKYYLFLKFFGFKYKCPFCGGHFRHFHPAGFDYPVIKELKIGAAGLRENVRCPKCNSSTRERLMYLYLKNQTNVFSEECKILHIAPEKNLQQKLKASANIEHISIDLSSSLSDLKMDIIDLKFPDENFNVVICSHVLEHIEDDVRAMKEICRVLKVGGMALIMVPISGALEFTMEDKSANTPEKREQKFGQSDHVRVYASDIVERLVSVGFIVERIEYAIKNKNEMLKFRLDEEDVLFVCKKNI